MAYAVATIGELGGALKGEPWPEVSPDWVRPGTAPGSPGVLAVSAGGETVNGGAVAIVALGGVLVGALGLWAWDRWGR